jgi:UDP-N-acetylglucosamine--N-acetylmuramyl-(pentapeptide) pyrophosphoryl-undecaprenol N-acetylglucosamine transferase
MRELIDSVKPDLVVGDEEFSSVSLALEKKLKNAMITDELELGFARSVVSRYIEDRVAAWYNQLQRDVSNILVPDFGSDRGNIHFMTPVVRTSTRSRRDVLESFGIDTESKMILLSASGSGIGKFLLDSTLRSLESLRMPDVHLVVTGLPGRKSKDKTSYLGVYRDNHELVAASDLVISTAGKSTIDEARSSGSPIIAIPIKNHSEQESNAAALGFRYEDITRLIDLIPKYLGRRTSPKNYTGASSIASYLAGLT